MTKKYKTSHPRKSHNTTNKEKRIKELEQEKSRLEEQINNIMREKSIHWFPHKLSRIKIGALSDTHIGSIYDNLPFLNFAYEVFDKEGCDIILHAGDVVDGQGNYKGQEYEQYAIGFDSQLEVVVKEYPMIDKPTYFIEGNHSFRKMSGAIIGKTISQARKDLKFLGVEDADIMINHNKKSIKVKLIHPSGGTAYALSYHSQKFIEALEGGTKPNLLLIGHYHRAEILPGYRDIYAVQCGSIQTQTPYHRSKRIAPMVGFWILNVDIDNWGVNNIESRFFKWYERGRSVNVELKRIGG